MLAPSLVQLPPLFAQQMQVCILQGCHPSCPNNKAADLQHLPVTVWGADHCSGSTAEWHYIWGMLPCSHWSSSVAEACPFPDNESAAGGMFWWLSFLCLQKTECITSPPCQLVRNETVGKWFSGKTQEAQIKLLKLSARHEKELQRWHRQDEHDVAQMRLILEQNEELHEDHKTAHLQNNDIIRSRRRHRGPCQTPNNVDKLLQRFGPQQERRAALQVEMNWHKVRLGVKSSPAPYIPSQHHQACRELELSLRPCGCSTVSCRFSVCRLGNLKFSFGH